MRLLWLLLLAIVTAGAIAWWRAGASPPQLAIDSTPSEQSRQFREPATESLASESLASGSNRRREASSEAKPNWTPSAAHAGSAPLRESSPGESLSQRSTQGSPASAEAPVEEPPPPSIERLPEGGVLLDGRFLIRGRGTADDPLRVPWDLLRSAQESFDPPEDKHDLPMRVTALSGQSVSITGYFAVTSGEEQTRNLLLMLNKWDGCCLGLPPTPYDAVEVTLAQPEALHGKHMIRYGTITGRFECEPFLVAGWLMGLYRLHDATLEWGG